MLFERSSLEQETGVLKPYYLQDGRDYLVFTVDHINKEVVHTVTAGKRFYLTGIRHTGSYYLTFYDGTSTSDPLAVAGSFSGVVDFASPVPFDDAVYCNTSVSADETCTFFGWEE